MFNVTAILSALERANARYIVVGGFAVILHGHLRATADLDLVIDLSSDNCQRALQALSAVGLRPRLPVAMQQFADPVVRRDWVLHRNMLVFQLWDPANELRTVDVFVQEPMDFETMWAESVNKSIHGDNIRIASIPHLIEMKRKAGRARDLDDIAALEEIARHTEPGQPA
jgi:hypothetical protein